MNEKDLRNLEIIILLCIILANLLVAYYLYTPINNPKEIEADDVIIVIDNNSNLEKVTEDHYIDIHEGMDVEIYRNVSSLHAWLVSQNFTGKRFQDHHQKGGYQGIYAQKTSGNQITGEQTINTFVVYYNPRKHIIVTIYSENDDNSALEYVQDLKNKE